jgi:hypothetical protein
LASTNEVRHDLLSWTIRQVFVNFEVFLGKLSSDLVGERFQLAESDSVVTEASLAYQLSGLVDTRLIVRGNEKQAVLFKMFNNMKHVIVIAGMSLLNAVPNWGLVSVLLCESSLFIHVGASDELDTKVVTEGFGSCDFILDNLSHSLEVALVAIHYYMLVTSVVLVRELLTAGFDSGLHEGLLGVNIKHAVSFLCEFSDCGDSLSERFKYLQVVL